MDKKEFDELGLFLLKSAKKNLESDGELAPMAFLHTRDNTLGIINGSMFFDSRANKDVISGILRDLIKEKDGDAIFLVTEAWVKKSNAKDKENIEKIIAADSIEHLEGTEEAIMILCETELYNKTITVPFMKGRNDEIVYGEMVILDGKVEGRFAQFFKKSHDILN